MLNLDAMSLDEIIEYFRKKNDDDGSGSDGSGSGASGAGNSDYPDPPCRERDFPRDDR